MAIPSRGFATDYYGGEIIRCAKFVVPDENATFVMPKTCPYNDDYIFQGVMKAEAARTITVEMGGYSKAISITTEFRKYTAHFKNVSPSTTYSSETKIIFPPGTYYLWNMMIERATSPSDWRPAPEDAEDYANEVSLSAEERAKVYAEERARGAVEAQTQADIFNKLTDGGKTQGIYLQDGKVYINGTYIQSGTIAIAKNGRETFYANVDTGDVRIVADSFSLTSGETLASTLANAESYADGAASSAVNGQTQADIFNKLTNNGQTQGIYLQSGKVYINADYIYGGTLKIGGANNQNGSISVKNAAGTEIFAVGQSGISSINLSSSQQVSQLKLSGTDFFHSYKSYIGTTSEGTIAVAIDHGQIAVGRYNESGSAFYNKLYLFAESRPSSAKDYYLNFDYGSASENPILWIQRKNSFGTAYDRTKDCIVIGDGMTVQGDFKVIGTKSRVADTDQYGDKLLYCYESPSPMFGDVGEGKIGEDGICYIWIDPVFANTISTSTYQVFLQKYGEGDVYIFDRKSDHFVVKGSPNLKFGWEIKAKQADYDQIRMETLGAIFSPTPEVYGDEAADYISKLHEGRVS